MSAISSGVLLRASLAAAAPHELLIRQPSVQYLASVTRSSTNLSEIFMESPHLPRRNALASGESIVPRCGSTRCSIQIQVATIKKMTAALTNTGVHGIRLMNDQSATLDSIPLTLLYAHQTVCALSCISRKTALVTFFHTVPPSNRTRRLSGSEMCDSRFLPMKTRNRSLNSRFWYSVMSCLPATN